MYAGYVFDQLVQNSWRDPAVSSVGPTITTVHVRYASGGKAVHNDDPYSATMTAPAPAPCAGVPTGLTRVTVRTPQPNSSPLDYPHLIINYYKCQRETILSHRPHSQGMSIGMGDVVVNRTASVGGARPLSNASQRLSSPVIHADRVNSSTAGFSARSLATWHQVLQLSALPTAMSHDERPLPLSSRSTQRTTSTKAAYSGSSSNNNNGIAAYHNHHHHHHHAPQRRVRTTHAVATRHQPTTTTTTTSASVSTPSPSASVGASMWPHGASYMPRATVMEGPTRATTRPPSPIRTVSNSGRSLSGATTSAALRTQQQQQHDGDEEPRRTTMTMRYRMGRSGSTRLAHTTTPSPTASAAGLSSAWRSQAAASMSAPSLHRAAAQTPRGTSEGSRLMTYASMSPVAVRPSTVELQSTTINNNNNNNHNNSSSSSPGAHHPTETPSLPRPTINGEEAALSGSAAASASVSLTATVVIAPVREVTSSTSATGSIRGTHSTEAEKHLTSINTAIETSAAEAGSPLASPHQRQQQQHTRPYIHHHHHHRHCSPRHTVTLTTELTSPVLRHPHHRHHQHHVSSLHNVSSLHYHIPVTQATGAPPHHTDAIASNSRSVDQGKTEAAAAASVLVRSTEVMGSSFANPAVEEVPLGYCTPAEKPRDGIANVEESGDAVKLLMTVNERDPLTDLSPDVMSPVLDQVQLGMNADGHTSAVAAAVLVSGDGGDEEADEFRNLPMSLPMSTSISASSQGRLHQRFQHQHNHANISGLSIHRSYTMLPSLSTIRAASGRSTGNDGVTEDAVLRLPSISSSMVSRIAAVDFIEELGKPLGNGGAGTRYADSGCGSDDEAAVNDGKMDESDTDEKEGLSGEGLTLNFRFPANARPTAQSRGDYDMRAPPPPPQDATAHEMNEEGKERGNGVQCEEPHDLLGDPISIDESSAVLYARGDHRPHIQSDAGVFTAYCSNSKSSVCENADGRILCVFEEGIRRYLGEQQQPVGPHNGPRGGEGEFFSTADSVPSAGTTAVAVDVDVVALTRVRSLPRVPSVAAMPVREDGKNNEDEERERAERLPAQQLTPEDLRGYRHQHGTSDASMVHPPPYATARTQVFENAVLFASSRPHDDVDRIASEHSHPSLSLALPSHHEQAATYAGTSVDAMKVAFDDDDLMDREGSIMIYKQFSHNNDRHHVRGQLKSQDEEEVEGGQRRDGSSPSDGRGSHSFLHTLSGMLRCSEEPISSNRATGHTTRTMMTTTERDSGSAGRAGDGSSNEREGSRRSVRSAVVAAKRRARMRALMADCPMHPYDISPEASMWRSSTTTIEAATYNHDKEGELEEQEGEEGEEEGRGTILSSASLSYYAAVLGSQVFATERTSWAPQKPRWPTRYHCHHTISAAVRRSSVGTPRMSGSFMTLPAWRLSFSSVSFPRPTMDEPSGRPSAVPLHFSEEEEDYDDRDIVDGHGNDKKSGETVGTAGLADASTADLQQQTGRHHEEAMALKIKAWRRGRRDSLTDGRATVDTIRSASSDVSNRISAVTVHMSYDETDIDFYPRHRSSGEKDSDAAAVTAAAAARLSFSESLPFAVATQQPPPSLSGHSRGASTHNSPASVAAAAAKSLLSSEILSRPHYYCALAPLSPSQQQGQKRRRSGPAWVDGSTASVSPPHATHAHATSRCSSLVTSCIGGDSASRWWGVESSNEGETSHEPEVCCTAPPHAGSMTTHAAAMITTNGAVTCPEFSTRVAAALRLAVSTSPSGGSSTERHGSEDTENVSRDHPQQQHQRNRQAAYSPSVAPPQYSSMPSAVDPGTFTPLRQLCRHPYFAPSHSSLHVSPTPHSVTRDTNSGSGEGEREAAAVVVVVGDQQSRSHGSREVVEVNLDDDALLLGTTSNSGVAVAETLRERNSTASTMSGRATATTSASSAASTVRNGRHAILLHERLPHSSISTSEDGVDEEGGSGGECRRRCASSNRTVDSVARDDTAACGEYDHIPGVEHEGKDEARGGSWRRAEDHFAASMSPPPRLRSPDNESRRVAVNDIATVVADSIMKLSGRQKSSSDSAGAAYAASGYHKEDGDDGEEEEGAAAAVARAGVSRGGDDLQLYCPRLLASTSAIYSVSTNGFPLSSTPVQVTDVSAAYQALCHVQDVSGPAGDENSVTASASAAMAMHVPVLFSSTGVEEDAATRSCTVRDSTCRPTRSMVETCGGGSGLGDLEVQTLAKKPL